MPSADQPGAAGPGSFVDRGRWHDDMITVVVCDDHAQLRRKLLVMLEREPDIEVIGEAAEGEQGIATCRDLAPDVVIVGMRVESIGGPRTSAGLRELVPVAQVVMLVTPEDVSDAVRAIKAGATGFINREVLDQAPSVVRAVSAGVAALPPLVAGDLLRELAETGDVARLDPPLSTVGPSLLEHLASGQSYAAAARALGIADHTAKNIAANLVERLYQAERADAVRLAVESQLGPVR
jgi:DNA-binding NarL/FixJ family response regulator